MPPAAGNRYLGHMAQLNLTTSADPSVASARRVTSRSIDEHFATLQHLSEAIARQQEYSRTQPPLLSVVIPVYNEVATIALVIDAVSRLPLDLEMIVVDDGSSDGTGSLLEELATRRDNLSVVLHGDNRGKGAALASGFARARGEVVIVQDADLEYDPTDIPAVVAPILAGTTSVVYGSRYLDASLHHDHSRLHRWGNAALTGLSNLFSGQQLTDMETCYKAFRRDVIHGIEIRQRRFGFEPEVTAKLARRGIRIHEVPIRYRPRSSSEGKKIGWRDLINTLWCIAWYRIRG